MSEKFRNFRINYQESSIGFENLAYLQSTENKCKDKSDKIILFCFINDNSCDIIDIILKADLPSPNDSEYLWSYIASHRQLGQQHILVALRLHY